MNARSTKILSFISELQETASGARFTALAALFLAAMVSGPAAAQQLVYQPANPSFGGPALNATYFLSLANAQNSFTKPGSGAGAGQSQSELFVSQLQSRLLSSLATQVNNAIFGANPQQNGTITFGNQVITFNRGLSSVDLTITNTLAGTTTNISIPTLVVTAPAP